MKKKKTRQIKKTKSRLVWIRIIVAFLLMSLALYYALTAWRYKTAVTSLKKEYIEFINIERKGEVLSGSAKEIREKVETKTKIPVILYHYVEVVKDPNDTIRKSLNINPYIFEKQLQDLKNNKYKTYFIKDVPGILSSKITYSTRSAILTFDDGYEDFYTDAFPLLKKYNTKATLYVVYDFIGRKGFLNKRQLSEIVKSGLVEIGSHAVHHIGLGGLADKQAKLQLKESKDLLEEILGIEIKTFAYPYGSFNERTPDMVKKSGYIAAVSVIPGSFHSEGSLYYLSRYRAGMFGDRMVEVLEQLNK